MIVKNPYNLYIDYPPDKCHPGGFLLLQSQPARRLWRPPRAQKRAQNILISASSCLRASARTPDHPQVVVPRRRKHRLLPRPRVPLQRCLRQCGTFGLRSGDWSWRLPVPHRARARALPTEDMWRRRKRVCRASLTRGAPARTASSSTPTRSACTTAVRVGARRRRKASVPSATPS